MLYVYVCMFLGRVDGQGGEVGVYAVCICVHVLGVGWVGRVGRWGCMLYANVCMFWGGQGGEVGVYAVCICVHVMGLGGWAGWGGGGVCCMHMCACYGVGWWAGWGGGGVCCMYMCACFGVC